MSIATLGDLSRRALLVAVPLSLLAASENTVPLATLVLLVYVLVAASSGSFRQPFRAGWAFLAIATIYLFGQVLRAPLYDSYGVAKAFYLILLGLPLMVTIATMVRGQDDLRFVAAGYLIVGSIAAVLGLATSNVEALGFGRYTILGNYCGVAAILALLAPVGIRWPMRLPLFMINVAGMVMSGSRQSLLVFAFGMLIALYAAARSLNRPGRANPLPLIVAGISVLLTPLAIQLPIFNLLLYRLSLLSGRNDGSSLNARTDLIDIALQQFLLNPLIGNGLGSFQWLSDNVGNRWSPNQYPHNVFAEVLAEQGLVGFGILMAPMLIAGLFLAWRLLRSADSNDATVLVLWISAIVIIAVSHDIRDRTWWFSSLLVLRTITRSLPPAEPAIPPLVQSIVRR